MIKFKRGQLSMAALAAAMAGLDSPANISGHTSRSSFVPSGGYDFNRKFDIATKPETDAKIALASVEDAHARMAKAALRKQRRAERRGK